MKKKIDRRPCRKYRSCWKLTYLYQTVVACEPPLSQKSPQYSQNTNKCRRRHRPHQDKNSAE